MSNRTSDCPPLLTPGEHVRNIDEIRELCVARFPLSSTRAAIWGGLQTIVAALGLQAIVCELLVDGSYLTEEIEPEDIDFAVVVTPQFYDGCNLAQRNLLDWIGDDKQIKAAHLCDCYLCIDFKEGDAGWFEGICDREWWLRFYSTSVVFKRERGIAVVRIGMGGER